MHKFCCLLVYIILLLMSIPHCYAPLPVVEDPQRSPMVVEPERQSRARRHPNYRSGLTTILTESVADLENYDPYAPDSSDDACQELFANFLIDFMTAQAWNVAIKTKNFPIESCYARRVDLHKCLFYCRLTGQLSRLGQARPTRFSIEMLAEEESSDVVEVDDRAESYSSLYAPGTTTPKCYRTTRRKKKRKRMREQVNDCLVSDPAPPGGQSFDVYTTAEGVTDGSGSSRVTELAGRPFYIFLRLFQRTDSIDRSRTWVDHQVPGLEVSRTELRKVPERTVVKACSLGIGYDMNNVAQEMVIEIWPVSSSREE